MKIRIEMNYYNLLDRFFKTSGIVSLPFSIVFLYTYLTKDIVIALYLVTLFPLAILSIFFINLYEELRNYCQSETFVKKFTEKDKDL